MNKTQTTMTVLTLQKCEAEPSAVHRFTEKPFKGNVVCV